MRLALFKVVVREYDEAIAFYRAMLGFNVIEDTDLGGGKRWVRLRPPGAGVESGCDVLLARAATPEQEASIGKQTGGRVFAFLHTDDFARDYELLRRRGVEFVRPPSEQEYGTVAVFRDLYGNE